MIHISKRKVNQAEVKRYSKASQRLEGDIKKKKTVGITFLIISALICIPIPIIAKLDLPTIFIGSIVIFSVFCFGAWEVASVVKKGNAQISKLKSIVAHGQVISISVQINKCVEVIEQEDEGACFVFQVDEQKVMVLQGQEFYSTKKFPSTEFTLNKILDGDGNIENIEINSSGKRIEPAVKLQPDDKFRKKIGVEAIQFGVGSIEDVGKIDFQPLDLKTVSEYGQ